MPRQHKLRKCRPPDTIWNAVSDWNADDDVPIREHLRLTVRSKSLSSSCLPLLSSEAPMLLLPDQTNVAGFLSEHTKASFVAQTVAVAHWI